MNFCVFASGSDGNCTLVTEGSTSILIDCGLSCRQITNLLKDHHIAPTSLAGVCITHDHGDHTKGMVSFAKKYPSIPFYATEGSHIAICSKKNHQDLQKALWRIITPGFSFPIESLQIHPFRTSHDAADSVGYCFQNPDGTSLGYATDLGYVPSLIQVSLAHCKALILESNHDRQMLYNSDRCWSLKQRIAGESGHLSNAQSAEFIDSILDSSPLHTLVLAHLSHDCNTSEEALASHYLVLRKHNRSNSIRLLAASQNTPTPVLEV